jgi:hypothetical protein
MLLEGAEASFERMEHRLRQFRGLTRVKRVLEQYALTKDMALQLGDVPVGLVKMLLFLSTIHGFAPTTRSPGRASPGAFPFLCIGGIRAASVEAPTQAFDGSQWLGRAREIGRMLQLGHRLRLCDNARLDDLASSCRQDHVAVGGLRIDHNFSGIGRADSDDRRCDNARLNDLASSYRQDDGSVGGFWIDHNLSGIGCAHSDEQRGDDGSK